jgi:hypothetical protein
MSASVRGRSTALAGRRQQWTGAGWARRVRVPRRPHADAFGPSYITTEFPPEALPALRRSRPGPLEALAERCSRLFEPRAERSAEPAPDPTLVLRRIIEPADGVDLATVEMLAEDEGVDRSTVHAVLARLRQAGTVRYARGIDGEEVFAWSRPGLSA